MSESRMVIPRDKRDRDKNRGTVPSRPLPISVCDNFDSSRKGLTQTLLNFSETQ